MDVFHSHRVMVAEDDVAGDSRRPGERSSGLNRPGIASGCFSRVGRTPRGAPETDDIYRALAKAVAGAGVEGPRWKSPVVRSAYDWLGKRAHRELRKAGSTARRPTAGFLTTSPRMT